MNIGRLEKPKKKKREKYIFMYIKQKWKRKRCSRFSRIRDGDREERDRNEARIDGCLWFICVYNCRCYFGFEFLRKKDIEERKKMPHLSDPKTIYNKSKPQLW